MTELEILDVDYSILLIDPYIDLEEQNYSKIEKDMFRYIRKMQNRLFVHIFEKTDEFGEFLLNPIRLLNDLFKKCSIPFLNEAEEKGLTERFIGIQQKIKGSQENLFEIVYEDIRDSMEQESYNALVGQKKVPFTSKLYEEDAFIKDIAQIGRKTYSKYVELNTNHEIIGAKISPLEEVFYSIIPKHKISLDEIRNELIKYTAHYSRLDIVELGINLLKIRGLIHIDENDYLEKVDPETLISLMDERLEKIKKTEKFLVKSQKDQLKTIERMKELVKNVVDKMQNTDQSILEKSTLCYILSKNLLQISELVPKEQHYPDILNNKNAIFETIVNLEKSIQTKLKSYLNQTNIDFPTFKEGRIALNGIIENIWPDESLKIEELILGTEGLDTVFFYIIYDLVIKRLEEEKQDILKKSKDSFLSILANCDINQQQLLPKELSLFVLQLTSIAKENIFYIAEEIDGALSNLTNFIEMSQSSVKYHSLNKILENQKSKRKDAILDQLFDIQFSEEMSERILNQVLRIFYSNMILLKDYVTHLVSSSSQDNFKNLERISNQIKVIFRSQIQGDIEDIDLVVSYLNTINKLSDEEYQELELFLVMIKERRMDFREIENLSSHYNIKTEKAIKSLLLKGKVKEHKQITRWYEKEKEIAKEVLSYEINDTDSPINLKISGITSIDDVASDIERKQTDYSFVRFNEKIVGDILLAPLCHPEIKYEWKEILYKKHTGYFVGVPLDSIEEKEEVESLWFRDRYGNRVFLAPDIPSNTELKPEMIKEGVLLYSPELGDFSDFIDLTKSQEFKDLLKSFIYNDNRIVQEYDDIAERFKVNEEVLIDYINYLKENKEKVLKRAKHMYDVIQLIGD